MSTYRDVTTGAGDTLPRRYERTMAGLEQITQAGYQVEVQWECDFDKGILADHSELKSDPVVQHIPLNIRHALYGGRTESIRLHHTAGDGETIHYFDVNHCMLLKDGLMKCSILPQGVYSILSSLFAAISDCFSASADPVPWNRIGPKTARSKRLPKGR